MWRLAVILLLSEGILGSPAPVHDPAQKSTLKRVSECLHSTDSLLCLKELTLDTLNGAIASDKPISVSSYFDIVKDPNVKLEEENMVEGNELEKVGGNSTARSMILDDILLDKVDQFLQSRSLKISLAPVFEGRKKKDKHGGMMLMAGLAMAGMMAQMAMGKIAFLAGAALIIAKIALLMSTMIGLKKLVSSSGGSEHVVVTAAAPSSDHGHGGYGGGGGWQRSLNGDELAYKAYYPIFGQNSTSSEVNQ